MLSNGIDPVQALRVEKAVAAAASANTFEAVARNWHENKRETWKERTAKNNLHRLEQDVFLLIGKKPIAEIKAPTLLDVFRQMENRGVGSIAKRNAMNCSHIFNFAIASGLTENNPVIAVRSALKSPIKGVHAAIIADLPESLRVLEKNQARMYPPFEFLCD